MAMLTTDQPMGIKGRVITTSDDGYEAARRVYNGMIDRRPRLIVQAADTDDVLTALRFGRERGLEIAVRGGGHSAPGFGTADGALVIDLSPMRDVQVDPAKRTVRAQGGVTWGEFNTAASAHGLAVTGGIISTTGIAGLTLGGGMGYLARGLGLSCDNLVSAEIVTADARRVVASADENADLFWAIRGGGGNFGVATELTYRLHPVGEILAGPLFFELDDAATVIRWYREFIKDAPEQFGGFPAFQIAPPLPFIPENRHGDTFLAFVGCWTGDRAQGERIFDQLRSVAPVVAEHVGPMPYPALNSAFDALLPAGLQNYWKGPFARELPDEAIAAHIEHGSKVPIVNSTAHIYSINGAVHRVAREDTAFPYRDATFAVVIAGAWPDPADNEKNMKWVRDYYEAIAPYSEAGGYINFQDADDQARIRANYGPNYERLAELKRKWDPENVFHLNQNIKPA